MSSDVPDVPDTPEGEGKKRARTGGAGMIIVECVTSCCEVARATTIRRLEESGWRAIRKCMDLEPTAAHGHKVTGRSHIGFCPICARKYQVEKSGGLEKR